MSIEEMIEAIEPENKDLVIKTNNTTTSVDEAFGITRARKLEMVSGMSKYIPPMYANTTHISQGVIIAVSSRLAKTPNELAWLAYNMSQFARMHGLVGPTSK